MPVVRLSLQTNPHSRHVTALVALLIASCLICVRSHAQGQVCPGERTDVQATVFDKDHQFVKDGTIEIYNTTAVQLSDVGQFFTRSICTHPPDSCPAARTSRYPRFSPFPLPRLDNAVFFPAVSFRDTFTTPAHFQAIAAATDANMQPGQQVSAGREIKPQWQIFLESIGGAAIITVFGGGIIGALLTSFLQRSAKEREIFLNQVDAEKQRRLQREQIYLDGEIKVVTDILELVTSRCSISENLIGLTTDRFQTDKNQSAPLMNYRNQVRSDFNNASDTWKSRREIVGALLGTYHGQESSVFQAWVRLRTVTTDFMKAAKKIYDDYYDNGQVSRPEAIVQKDYVTERDAVENAIGEFSEALFRFRSRFKGDVDRLQRIQTSPA